MKLLSCCLVALASFGLLSPLARAEQVFWVSPTGDDSATGGQSDPFQTILQAQKAVREAIEFGMTEDVRVRIHAGTYLIEDTLTFTADDRGRDGFTVTYSGVDGEAMPELVGASSYSVTWDHSYAIPAPGGGQVIPVWVALIPKSIDFRALYARKNGDLDRLVRARTPNDTYLKVAAGNGGDPGIQNVIYYDEQDLPSLFDTQRVNIMAWGRPRPTTKPNFVPVSYYKLTSHDPVSNRLDLAPDTFFFKEDHLYWAEGAIEFLDAPGEWVLVETPSGPNELHVVPRDGGAPEDVVIPAVETILDLRNTSRIHFEGLNISVSDWVDEVEKPWAYHNADGTTRAGVLVVGSDHIVFSECWIHNTGCDGIRVVGSSDANTITGCLIEKTAVMGLVVWSWAHQASTAHVLTQNIVRSCGESFPWGGGIVMNEVTHCLVGNNDVSDTQRYGIYLRGGTVAHNTVERNDIYDVLQGSGDAGGITIWNGLQDNLIFNNVIHDVASRPDHLVKQVGPRAIYIDDFSTDTSVLSNLIYDIGTSVVAPEVGMTNIVIKGSDNLVQNNVSIIREATGVKSHFGILTEATCAEISRNILFDNGQPVYIDYNGSPALRSDVNCGDTTLTSCSGGSAGGETPEVKTSDKNVFHHDGFPFVVDYADTCSLTFTEWQTLSAPAGGVGYDATSIFADPNFEDEAADDFRLKPASPAYSIGFVDIDLVDVGATLNTFP